MCLHPSSVNVNGLFRLSTPCWKKNTSNECVLSLLPSAFYSDFLLPRLRDPVIPTITLHKLNHPPLISWILFANSPPSFFFPCIRVTQRSSIALQPRFAFPSLTLQMYYNAHNILHERFSRSETKIRLTMQTTNALDEKVGKGFNLLSLTFGIFEEAFSSFAAELLFGNFLVQ